jgi:hypothetical protein
MRVAARIYFLAATLMSIFSLLSFKNHVNRLQTQRAGEYGLHPRIIGDGMETIGSRRERGLENTDRF